MPSFEVLIRDTFSSVSTDAELRLIDNKSVFSLINDFEDGKWRNAKFNDFIWDNIAETALSAQERESLIDRSHSSLVRSAQKLRLLDGDKKDPGKGGEVAEIVLYGIMKEYYSALPVVPKIFYKQNKNDYAKGSDSIHIVLEGEDDFSLWFGEAKFYNDIADTRLGEVVASVENSLQTDRLKKENSIITSLSDLKTLEVADELKTKILHLLSPDTSIDQIKPKLHIPILLLHECEITKGFTELTDAYRNQIKQYHCDRATSYFKKQISKLANAINKYSEIKFHIFLVPVPSKGDVVSKFISTAQNYRNN